MKGMDANTSSGKNMNSVSLSKRLAMATNNAPQQYFQNNTIDFSNQMIHGFGDMNNTALI